MSLHYYGNQTNLEYDFVLEPNADPNLITLAIDGAKDIYIDNKGDLVLPTPVGAIKQSKPFVYQEVDGTRREITGRYVVKSKNEIGFELGQYDRNRRLVIDPQLLYSTYLGGNAGDSPAGIGVDTQGQAYLGGTATSINFPTTVGAYDNNRGDLYYEDAFVTKLNQNGTALVYSTFIGGIYGDDAYDIAVDRHGNAYITGPTSSPDYPTTPGAFQRIHAGDDPTNEDTQNSDVFVTKLSDQGTMVYSTFIGGRDDDRGFSIAVDGSGNAYITGDTESNDFRTTPSALQVTAPIGPAAQYDNAFISKLNAAGSALSYSSYLGGSSFDLGRAIAVDADGAAYVTGSTSSPDFPNTEVRTGPGFVLKMTPTLSGNNSLFYSTRIGNTGWGVAVDRLKQVYVAANTFVLKLSASSDETLYHTTVRNASVFDIAVDPRGTAYITGSARSNFPATPGSPQTTYGGGSTDAFIAKLKSSNGALLYASYLGGSAADSGSGVAIDLEGKPYLAGSTDSSNFPVTPSAFQTTFGGDNGVNDSNGFVAKFDPPPPPLIFVPGIGGTKLCDADSFGPCLWPGFTPLITDHTDLSLDPKEKNEVPQHIIPYEVWTGPSGYQPFIESLKKQGEYRVYNDSGDPFRRTFAGCDLTQQNKNPNLFLFPYDWRKSNASNPGNADLLAEFVQCVRRFYPDSEVNIVTHSMGGVLARRYILDHPADHHVNKMITMSAPWLGAPKALSILETGKPFVDFYSASLKLENHSLTSISLRRRRSRSWPSFFLLFINCCQVLNTMNSAVGPLRRMDGTTTRTVEKLRNMTSTSNWLKD